MAEQQQETGWSALETALTGVYGDQQPRHWGTAGEWRFAGPVPLRGISAYWNDTAPTPHWHFVTFGLSELFEKQSADLGRSGFGFELTLRVAPAIRDEEPPAWALGLLQNLAGYIVQTGHPFAPGHTFNTQGPLTDEPPTRLGGLVFTADPGLPEVSGPFGRAIFLQAVGLTDDERAAAKAWTTEGLLSLLRARSPLLVTDLSRPSLLDDPALAEQIATSAAREGSSMGALLVPGLSWTAGVQGQEFTLELPASSVEDLKRLLSGRLLHGKSLSLGAPGGEDLEQVRFKPGARDAVRVERGALEVVATPELVETLQRALAPRAGIHRLQGLPGLTLRVRGGQ
jgi:hypothetical protein